MVLSEWLKNYRTNFFFDGSPGDEESHLNYITTYAGKPAMVQQLRGYSGFKSQDGSRRGRVDTTPEYNRGTGGAQLADNSKTKHVTTERQPLITDLRLHRTTYLPVIL